MGTKINFEFRILKFKIQNFESKIGITVIFVYG